ncbi:hypothetical protein BC941DRAFT_431294 [Chlamydoabsidia padenii]|nr:hypothetical protein BC941DRAFT_431294 [Chlamydoabsidia padenii]
MKTTSLIAVSALLGLSGVSGQLISTEKADAGMDIPFLGKDQPPTNPGPLFPKAPSKKQALPKGKGPRPALDIPHKVPHVVHVTKTRTQIVYPTPNPRLWKTLPEFPAHGPKGKIVAEFVIDEEGHFHKYGNKHGGHYRGYKEQQDWSSHPDFGHKGGYKQQDWSSHPDFGHKGGYKHQGHSDITEHKGEHGPKGDHKGTHHHEEHHHKEMGGSQKETTTKKIADAPKPVDPIDIMAQNNGTLPSGVPQVSASLVSGQHKASAMMSASAIPKNAAAASSSSSKTTAATSSTTNTSSPRPNPSSATSGASSNTRTVSFIAIMAATAAWCLA